MQISTVIERLRATLTSWGNRIYGVAEYEAAEDKTRLAMPSMYVMLGGSTAKTMSNSSFLQELDDRLKIIVVISQTDRTGKNAQDQIESIRSALFSALLNYQLDPDAHTIEFVSDKMIDMDKARYFHMFEFKQVTWLSADDGAPLILEDFNNYYADWNLTETDPAMHPDAQDDVSGIFT